MEHRIKIQLADSNQVWKNRNEVIKKLYSAAVDDTVIIDTLFEGISLQEYGVAGVIDTWVAETNRDPVTVKIDNVRVIRKEEDSTSENLNSQQSQEETGEI